MGNGITNHYQFNNQKEAKNIIFEYIEVFYNRVRIHSANGYLSPVEYESLLPKMLQKVA